LTVESILEKLDEEYTTTAVRDLGRHLRDTDNYDLRISGSKEALLNQLEEEVQKKDLLAAIDQVLPDFWDEDTDEGEEDDSDGDEE
jgi:hypothetical protein